MDIKLMSLDLSGGQMRSFLYLITVMAVLTVAIQGDAFAATLNDSPQTLMQLSKKGDSEADYLLGVLFLNGSGVQKNIDVGLKFTFRAAFRGNPEAANFLGGAYYVGVSGLSIKRDAATSLSWLMRAVLSGYASSANKLAGAFSSGANATPDMIQATIFSNVAYRLLSEHPELQIMYGVPLSKEKIDWYKKALAVDMSRENDFISSNYKGEQGAFARHTIKDGVDNIMNMVGRLWRGNCPSGR